MHQFRKSLRFDIIDEKGLREEKKEEIAEKEATVEKEYSSHMKAGSKALSKGDFATAKKEFEQKRRFYPKESIRTRSNGTTFTTFADLYEIDNHQLNDVSSFEDLKSQLNG